MDGILDDIEQLIVDYITHFCDREEQKEVWDGAACLNALTMDAEHEIKEQLWFLVKSELRWGRVVEKIQDYLKNEPSSESEENDQASHSTASWQDM